jgi:hypothetical protein
MGQAKAAIADAEAQMRQKSVTPKSAAAIRNPAQCANGSPAAKLGVPRAPRALVAEHENVHQIELRIRSLAIIWRAMTGKPTPPWSSVHPPERLAATRVSETDERRYQNNRAIEATINARAAYMDGCVTPSRLTAKTSGTR